MTLSGMGRWKKKYALMCSWHEIKKDEIEDELKMRTPS